MNNAGRILAVDDSPMNLAMIEEILGDDYELRCLSSGEEALALVESWSPDLVLLDVMMPGMDGYETCRRLREHASLKHLKVILISAKSEVDDRLRGYEHGADDYVIKPFDIDELMAKVKVFLRLKTVEELDRVKLDLLRLLNHETRTPLNGVLGYLELVEDLRGCIDETERELLEAARESGRRLSRLLQKCLMYGYLMSGSCRLGPERPDVFESLERARRDNRAQATRAGVTVTIRGERPAVVPVDSEYMNFAINALVENAIRYSPPGGEVALSAVNDGEFVRITVSDQGPGIPEEERGAVFQALTTSDIGHHTEGNRLSLAIVKKICSLSGGDCSVVDIDGGGARFELTLPVPAVEFEDSLQPVSS